jgi:hypothetical protein
MSASRAPDAIRKTASVRCDLNTAFRVWTEQIDAWWPKSHSRSGNVSTTTLVPKGNGASEFTVREVFSGPLLALIGGSIPNMAPVFERFVAGLKRRAEAAS